MVDILKIAGQIAGIGGLVLGVFLLLFKEVIRKNIFPKLNPKDAYRAIRLFMILVWSIAVLGILAWGFSEWYKGNNNGNDNGDLRIPTPTPTVTPMPTPTMTPIPTPTVTPMPTPTVTPIPTPTFTPTPLPTPTRTPIPTPTFTPTPRPPIVVNDLTVTFHTNDDDKDPDTGVSVAIQNVAEWHQTMNTRFPDYSEVSKELNPNTVLLSQLSGNTLEICISPNGNDTWRLNMILSGNRSDGRRYIFTENNINLNEAAYRCLKWKLP